MNEDGSYTRKWVHAMSIDQLSQTTGTQDAENKGTAILDDGSKLELIQFNETLETLPK